MKRREFIKWTAPIVIVVTIPNHASASKFADTGCDDLTGASGSVSALAEGIGATTDVYITITGRTQRINFGVSEVLNGTTRDGVTISGTAIGSTDECLTKMTLTVQLSATETYTFDLVKGG